MTMLAVEGAELYYELHGEGPPLVLIHGASGTHLSWWQQVAELRYRHSCLIYDLRGYGRSRPTGDHDPGDGHAHVRDLEALIAHVGFGSESVSIMGASLGSAPALHYAAEHPERMDKLVLCCGPGNTSTPRIKEGWVRRRERMAARYREVQEHGLVLPPGIPPVRSSGEKERFSTAYHPYGPVGASLHLDFPELTFLYAEIMASAGGPPTPQTFPVFETRPVTAEEAATLKFPVLVVGGTNDPLFPMEELQEVASLFPNGRAVFFPGAGHLAYYERPRRFNDLVTRFLAAGHAAVG
jgi:pimeloyl-ACP methyl ester carboxylesterase